MSNLFLEDSLLRKKKNASKWIGVHMALKDDEELVRWIVERAAANERSVAGEVRYILKQAHRAEQAAE
jgi:hypothetical protein